MRTPQGSEHTTCAKVVEARAVRLTGAVSIDRRKAEAKEADAVCCVSIRF